jgi:dTDP-4-amino-4,6-dideoxygalactose transaminase
MADVDHLSAIAQKNNLLLMEDCAQAHGAQWHNRLAGTIGHMASFSFYPTKNLGALGDGGAIITNDDTHAANLRKLRNYGQTRRYYHAERGVNSRLDEMQAALLRVKLTHLDAHNSRRREVAALYNAGLEEVIKPVELAAAYHVYHLYVARHTKRDALMDALQQRGVGTLIHYPIPNHLQEGYADLGYKLGSLPVTERMAGEILSLPLYIGLENDAVNVVIETINAVAKELS